MDGEVILTADDIVRAGACREGVAEVLRRLAGTIAAAMPVSAILWLLAERELGYVTRAAQLDGDCYGWNHGGSGGRGYGDVHGGDGYGNGGGGGCYGYRGYGDSCGDGGGGDGYGYAHGRDGGGDGVGDCYGDRAPSRGDGFGDGGGGDGYGDGYSYCAPDAPEDDK